MIRSRVEGRRITRTSRVDPTVETYRWSVPDYRRFRTTSSVGDGRHLAMPRWLLALKVALAGLLLCGALFPQVGGFEGKGMAFRLPLFISPALIVPIHHAIRRRRDPDRSYPWALDAGLTIPFLLDTFGNAVGLYDSVDVTDDVLHFVNWFFLMGGITTSIGFAATRSTSTPRWLVWLAGTGVGALAIIGWEIAEYGVMKAGVGNLSLTYGDTLFDLALSSAGGSLGAWLVTQRAQRT